MPAQKTIAVHACAKVNLALAVGPPEPVGPRTGWHPIATWMHAIALRDALTVRAADRTSFDLRWAADAGAPEQPIVWPIERDLVARAHAALEARAGRTLPTRVTLRKTIPTGGGLGGGSADAAAALVALRALHTLELDDDALRAIAITLGSDVPFFIDHAATPRPALVEGFGDRVERTAAERTGRVGIVLLLPPFGCATPEVYRAFDTLPAPRVRFEDRAERLRALARQPLTPNAELFNDLEPAAALVEPRLQRVLEIARDATPHRAAHMTGSGSACFALAETDRVAELTAALAERLASAAPGLGVRVLPAALESPATPTPAG